MEEAQNYIKLKFFFKEFCTLGINFFKERWKEKENEDYQNNKNFGKILVDYIENNPNSEKITAKKKEKVLNGNIDQWNLDLLTFIFTNTSFSDPNTTITFKKLKIIENSIEKQNIFAVKNSDYTKYFDCFKECFKNLGKKNKKEITRVKNRVEEKISKEIKDNFKNKEFTEIKENGNKFFKEKKFDIAITCYQKVLEIANLTSIQKAIIYNNIATCFYQKNTINECIENLENALKNAKISLFFCPNFAKPLYRIGLIYERKNKNNKAIKFYDLCLQIEPNEEVKLNYNKLINQNKGNIKKEEKKTNAEEKENLQKYYDELEKKLFENVLILPPPSRQVYIPFHPHIFNFLERKNDFSIFVNLGKNGSETANNMCTSFIICLELNKELAFLFNTEIIENIEPYGIIENLSDAIKFDFKSIFIETEFKNILSKMFLKIIRLNKKSELDEDTRLCYILLKYRFNEILEFINKSIEIYPLNKYFHFFKGLKNTQNQNFSEAISSFEKIQKIDDKFVNALYWNGYSLSKINKKKESLKYFKQFIKIAQKDHQYYPEAHYQIAIILKYFMNDEKTAQNYYNLGKQSEKNTIPLYLPYVSNCKMFFEKNVPNNKNFIPFMLENTENDFVEEKKNNNYPYNFEEENFFKNIFRIKKKQNEKKNEEIINVKKEEIIENEKKNKNKEIINEKKEEIIDIEKLKKNENFENYNKKEIFKNEAKKDLSKKSEKKFITETIILDNEPKYKAFKKELNQILSKKIIFHDKSLTIEIKENEKMIKNLKKELIDIINSIQPKSEKLEYKKNIFKILKKKAIQINQIMKNTNTEIIFLDLKDKYFYELTFENKFMFIIDDTNNFIIKDKVNVQYIKSDINDIEIENEIDGIDILIKFSDEKYILNTLYEKFIDMCNNFNIDSVVFQIYESTENFENKIENYMYFFFNEILRNQLNTKIKNIYLFENNKKNLKIITKYLKKYQKIDDFYYKFQWMNDQSIYVNYVRKINTIISNEFKKDSLGNIFINYDPLTLPGSHEIDLDNMTITNKKTKNIDNLLKSVNGWYKAAEKLDIKVENIINEKLNENISKFELFLEKYYIDFSNMTQQNVSNIYDKKKIKFNKIILKKINIEQKAISEKKFLEILFYNNVDLKNAKTNINDLITNCYVTENLFLHGNLQKNNIDYLNDVKSKYDLVLISGKLEKNNSILIQGLDKYISKFKNIINILKQTNEEKVEEKIITENIVLINQFKYNFLKKELNIDKKKIYYYDNSLTIEIKENEKNIRNLKLEILDKYNKIEPKLKNIEYKYNIFQILKEKALDINDIMKSTNTEIKFSELKNEYYYKLSCENKTFCVINDLQDFIVNTFVEYKNSNTNEINVRVNNYNGNKIIINFTEEHNIINNLRNRFIDECNNYLIDSVVFKIYESSENFENKIEDFLNFIFDEILRNNLNLKIKNIYLLESDSKNLEIISNLLQNYQNNDDFYYQFQWMNDQNIYVNYDRKINFIISNEFKKDSLGIFINHDPLTKPGTHEIDLDNMTITHKNTKNIDKLIKKILGWYKGIEKLENVVSKIIDENLNRNIKQFDLFLSKYLINFKDKTQTNITSNFIRKINYFKINNKKIIIDKKYYQENGLIEILFYNNEDFTKAKEKIDTLIKSFYISESINIPSNLQKKDLEYLEGLIKKYKLNYLGKLEQKNYIILKGLDKYITDFKNILKIIVETSKEKILDIKEKIQIEYPVEWVEDSKPFSIHQLSQFSNEYLDIKTKFLKHLDFTIISISRIQNKKLYEDYIKERETLFNYKKSHGVILPKDCNEIMVWHGTRENPPEVIYESQLDGFDLSYANDGLWGRGLYFAERSDYSAVYSHRVEKDEKMIFYRGKKTSKKMLLVKIFIGQTTEIAQDHSLRKPPFLPGNKELRYDSVKGQPPSGPIYVLYHMRRAYPFYEIEFE